MIPIFTKIVTANAHRPIFCRWVQGLYTARSTFPKEMTKPQRLLTILLALGEDLSSPQSKVAFRKELNVEYAQIEHWFDCDITMWEAAWNLRASYPYTLMDKIMGCIVYKAAQMLPKIFNEALSLSGGMLDHFCERLIVYANGKNPKVTREFISVTQAFLLQIQPTKPGDELTIEAFRQEAEKITGIIQSSKRALSY